MAERPLSEDKLSADRPAIAVGWLFFFLPVVLGFAAFTAEYTLFSVPAVLAFYQRHSGLIGATSIGAVYRSTGNPLYLYFAIYAVSLPGIFAASAAILIPNFLRSRSEYFDTAQFGEGRIVSAVFLTLCVAAIYFALPEIYTGAKIHIPKYGWIRFSPNLLGAFYFAVFFWLPAMCWTLLLAAVIGRVMRLVDHLLWKSDSRRRQRDRMRRQVAARRKRHQFRDDDGQRPDRT